MSEVAGNPWSDEERVAVARLAGLEHMTVARLRALLSVCRPIEAIGLAGGLPADDGPVPALLRRDPGLAHRWRHGLRQRTADRIATELDSLGVHVLGPTDEQWPASLLVDPDPPSALFVAGVLGGSRRRVAVVGTRNPTEHGRRLAAQFGHGLAEAGVCVVSGLALGIDGAAHRGALSVEASAPLAVVANGHDRPYPRRHAALWREVSAHGAVVSEWPPGTAPDAFRFPLRNRIIAAVSEAVIVVESRETGGSLLTAREAAERDVPVMAVPGAPGARASAGTNQLVQEGAALVVDVADVLTHLELDHSRAAGTIPADPRPAPDPAGVRLLEVVRRSPITIERLAAECDLALGDAAIGLARLERAGWVFEVDGWFEALDEWSLLVRGMRPGEGHVAAPEPPPASGPGASR